VHPVNPPLPYGRRERGVSATVVLREPWSADPLTWIHRAEARGIARELRAPLRTFSGDGGLLRLSDPAMLGATAALTRAGIPYIGPGAAALTQCYDKQAATERVRAAGIDCPADAISFPMMIKPRRGSDSIGVHIIRSGPVPAGYLAQERIVGTELTVALLHGSVGAPLRIELPEGVPYSFARKYLMRPRRVPIIDKRVQDAALRIAALLGVDWAARVDFIYDRRRDRLCFLECDAAPLIGLGSAFADSLAAGGMPRAGQLARLILGACS
jgi:D-alanine-D-alanine ligase-like ATP-grasp enzyme